MAEQRLSETRALLVFDKLQTVLTTDQKATEKHQTDRQPASQSDRQTQTDWLSKEYDGIWKIRDKSNTRERYIIVLLYYITLPPVEMPI